MSSPQGQQQCSPSVPGPRPTTTAPRASPPSPIESAPAAKTERYTSPWMRLLGHPPGPHRESAPPAPPRTPYVPTHAASSFARTASPLVWRCKDRVGEDKCSTEGGGETEDSREDGEGAEAVDESEDGAGGGLGAIRHGTLAPTDHQVSLADPDNRARHAVFRPHLHAGPGPGPGPDTLSPAAPYRHQDSAYCSTTSSSPGRRTHDSEAHQAKSRRGSSPCSGQPRSPPSSTVKRQPSSIARCIGEYVRPSRKGRLADTGR